MAEWKYSKEMLQRNSGGGGSRNRTGRREKWPKKSWEEGEIGGKRREEGEIGSESREKGDLVPCSSTPKQNETKQNKTILKTL